jgi:hypothetical protein
MAASRIQIKNALQKSNKSFLFFLEELSLVA